MPPHTFRDLLDRYALGEREFVGAELDEDSQCDLRGIRLAGADLSQSFIVADFRGADLRGVRFVEANVKTCDFRDADLREADFSGAALCATRFKGANLEGTRFENAFHHDHVLISSERPDW